MGEDHARRSACCWGHVVRISRRTARVVRLAVPVLRANFAVMLLDSLIESNAERVIAREVIRREMARRARADIRTYWATLAKDGE